MKVKKIKIKSREEVFAHAREFAQKLDRGEKVKPYNSESFESLDAVRSMLTDQRLALWRVIRDQKPDSISALSKLVDRDFKSVHTDLNVLVNVGLVQVRKTKGKRGDTQKPTSLADSFIVEVA